VLTGEGADEVFGGYDLFKEAKVRRFLARQPESKWRGRILERLYPYLQHSPAAGRAFTQRFFSEGLDEIREPWFAHIPRMTTTRRALQFLRPELHERATAWDPKAALRATLPEGIDRWLPQGRDQYVEAHTLMSGYLLSSQGDRMAMAASIEARFPFLDHRVIEFANRLPPQYKLRGLTEKYFKRRCTSCPGIQSQQAALPLAGQASFFGRQAAIHVLSEDSRIGRLPFSEAAPPVREVPCGPSSVGQHGFRAF
jgi:asparagine synthase (glutamine-hydrolysing)